MPALDIFNTEPAFSVHSLTARINQEPFRPGQVSASGIFEEDSVTTTRVSVELRQGKLSLVEPTARGGNGETVDDEDRTLVPFDVDHYEREDSVLADEVQNVRAFGSETEVEQIEDRVVRKGARHLRDLDMTLEHQRVGAIKGIVTAKSGRVLHNLYDRFEIAVPAAVALSLNAPDANIGKEWQDVVYGIEDDLDEAYSGFHVFTGRNFHSAMWTHKRIRETFLVNGAGGGAIMRQDVPDRFEFGNAVFERYRTGARAKADLGAAYIDDNKARVVPLGVPELFITRFAPADFEETVNTPGLPRYMRQYPMPNGKGRRIQVQSNAISLCTRPQALRELTIAP